MNIVITDPEYYLARAQGAVETGTDLRPLNAHLREALASSQVSGLSDDEKVVLTGHARDFYLRVLDEGRLTDADAARYAVGMAVIFSQRKLHRGIETHELPAQSSAVRHFADREQQRLRIYDRSTKNLVAQLKELGFRSSDRIFRDAISRLRLQMSESADLTEEEGQKLVDGVVGEVTAHYQRCWQTLETKLVAGDDSDVQEKALSYLARLTPLSEAPSEDRAHGFLLMARREVRWARESLENSPMAAMRR